MAEEMTAFVKALSDPGVRRRRLDSTGVKIEVAPRTGLNRRRFLLLGLGRHTALVVGAGAAGFELVSHGVLPGQQTLDQLDGACDVATAALAFSPAGPSHTGTFYSHARNTTVGYTMAYPPRPRPRVSSTSGRDAARLRGEPHTRPERDDASPGCRSPGRWASSAPMAMVTVDGGNGYWNPHPGDDPMAMVVDKFIPMCQRRGLHDPQQDPHQPGISMGGYGALLMAEKYPDLIAAVAAISPAIWTSYPQARAQRGRL